MSTLEDRIATLEQQTRELIDCLLQIARDADLLGSNITNTLKKFQQQRQERDWKWNPDKIFWQQATSSKGPYEKCQDEANPDYQAMLDELVNHQGKLKREGRFYWLFIDGKTVGRTLQK